MFESWAIVIITIALLIVTYLYMQHTKRLADDTKRMADIMGQEFELRIAPFIVVDRLPWTGGINSREYHPVVTNRGFLPIHIVNIILEGWSRKSPSMVFRTETKIDKTLGSNDSIKEGECIITLRKSDVSIEDIGESEDTDFNNFLYSSEGKIYFTYLDRNGEEQKTIGKYLDQL